MLCLVLPFAFLSCFVFLWCVCLFLGRFCLFLVWVIDVVFVFLLFFLFPVFLLSHLLIDYFLPLSLLLNHLYSLFCNFPHFFILRSPSWQDFLQLELMLYLLFYMSYNFTSKWPEILKNEVSLYLPLPFPSLT